jgi:hypothetical protein
MVRGVSGSPAEAASSPPEPLTGRALQGMTLRMIGMVSVILISYYLFVVLPESREGLDLAFIFNAIAITAVLLFVAASLKLLLRGSGVTLLHRALVTSSIVVFLVILLISSPLAERDGVIGLCMLLLVIGALVIALPLVSRPRARFALLLRAFLIGLGGLATSMALHIVSPGAGGRAGDVILAASVFAALVSLLALWDTDRRRWLRTLAALMSSDVNVVLLAASLGLLASYFLVIRPEIGTTIPEALSFVEWAMLVVLLLTLALAVFGYLRSASREIELGEWKKLVQTVRYEKGELRSASGAVRDFVEKDRKEGLIVLITSVLQSSRVPPKRVEEIVGMVLRHGGEEPPFRSVLGGRAAELAAKEERRKVVLDVLRACAESVGAESVLMALEKETGGKVVDQGA